VLCCIDALRVGRYANTPMRGSMMLVLSVCTNRPVLKIGIYDSRPTCLNEVM
jgi:hypothetical protein